MLCTHTLMAVALCVPPLRANSSLVPPGRKPRASPLWKPVLQVGTIRIVPPKVHSRSELKYRRSSSRGSAKKWLTASALSCSLEVHWLRRNVRETMPKCHRPELAWGVLPLFPSSLPCHPPHHLDHSSISDFVNEEEVLVIGLKGFSCHP